MRVHVVSDVHGAAEALSRAGDGADALVLLGDLVEFVDYADPSAGILGRVLGPEVSAGFGRLRAAGRPAELREFARVAWSRFADPAAVVEEAVREQYAVLFAALTAPTYAIAGNVDLPHLWPEFAGPGVRLVEGRAVQIGGLSFGFIGGVPLPPGLEQRGRGPWQPYVREAAEYAAAVRALPPVDVLCSHAPPAVPLLAYDVVTRREEWSSTALRERLHRDAPRVALFGHVHQPLVARARTGPTECVNVGHFRRRPAPYVLRW